MYLSDLIGGLRRRWYITLIGLLITAGLCLLAADRVGPTYESTASVVLVPGKATITQGSNPFLYLGGLTQARDVLVRSLESDDVLGPIAETHPGAEVTILPDASTSGPMMSITVDGPTEGTTQGALTDALHAIPRELGTLQDDIDAPADSRIAVLVLTADQAPTVLQKKRLRAVVAVGVVGLLATVFLTGLIDGLLLAAGNRKADRAAHPDGVDLNAHDAITQRAEMDSDVDMRE